mmetsp:Transcript_17106/g.39896  ORF Transcript_17106/g.39896 Transcript_17106/m.39896 type:complete len:467 (-) Transcript_17106:32-1432(-)
MAEEKSTLLPVVASPGQSTTGDKTVGAKDERSFGVYLLFLVAFLSVQFGHGSNIGVAVSLPGDSKAMNLALGSFVMIGVSLGLPITPWACRKFGIYRVCRVCVVIDALAILLMLWPNIDLRVMYVARFLVGFFEAPFLPYLQQWLACFGTRNWNVWNTVLHAMVPLGENIGFLAAQELVELGFHWQWAFAGQFVAFVLSIMLCAAYGGDKYLNLDEEPSSGPWNDSARMSQSSGGGWNDAARLSQSGEVEYAPREMWCTFWTTNVALAAQLGFLSGWKYVIRAYSMARGFSLHFTLCAFSAIALVGPSIGGMAAMSGQIIRPDQWSQHLRTLTFLMCTSGVAALFAFVVRLAEGYFFWLILFACFVFAGGVYPAAQGIINISLTEDRVIDASVYQVQCNNLLFAMPMPFVIGTVMDRYGIVTTLHGVLGLQAVTCACFTLGVFTSFSNCTGRRRTGPEVSPEDALE